MRIKDLLTERDDAVSPVIGVILMVAITVILAAVIASFVLGFGPGATAPNANFAFENKSGNDKVNITHDGGETVQAENLYIAGNNTDPSSRTAWKKTNGTATGTKDGKDAVVTGDSAQVAIKNPGSQWTVKVIWVSDDGSKSQDLASRTGQG